jgi:hypothetical protein
VTTPPSRPNPFDLVFASIADERFPPIREALAAAARDPRDRDAFLLTREAVTLLRELRPEEGMGEGIDQLAAFLHHAYLYWAGGQLLRALTPEELDAVLAARASAAEGPASPPAEPDQPDPHAGAYVQLPERRVWARPVEDAAFEPLDGLFGHLVPGTQELRALGVFGLHPDRMGFTVVEATGPRTPGLARANGSPLFAPTLPGAAAAGLNSITGTEELVELGWRVRDLPEDD